MIGDFYVIFYVIFGESIILVNFGLGLGNPRHIATIYGHSTTIPPPPASLTPPTPGGEEQTVLKAPSPPGSHRMHYTPF